MTTATSPRKVFVVDDDEALRNSLRWLIESAGLRVQTFASAQEFLDNAYPGQAGCLLLDVRMPGMSGLELQSQLENRSISLPVIIITGHGDISMAVKAMQAGAVDFIEKPFDDEQLLQAIQRALDASEEQRERRTLQLEIAARISQLTPREQEVMAMVTAGKSNREIAAELDVSSKTVEAHRARVMEKMQAQSLAELVRMTIVAAGTLDDIL
jgi:RNA polymerase sigma factor (sigma-70 family)